MNKYIIWHVDSGSDRALYRAVIRKRLNDPRLVFFLANIFIAYSLEYKIFLIISIILIIYMGHSTNESVSKKISFSNFTTSDYLYWILYLMRSYIMNILVNIFWC